MTRTMLVVRTTVAVITLALLAWVLIAGGPWILVPMTVVSLLGVREYFRLLAAMERPYLRVAGLLGAAVIPSLAYFGGERGLLGGLFFTLLLLAAPELRAGVRERELHAAIYTFHGVFLIAGGVAFIMLMRNLDQVLGAHAGHTYRFAGPYGIWWVLTTAGAVAFSDTGGHLIGANFGRRKLSPISPNKTVEGALGSIAGSILAMFIGTILFRLGLGLLQLVALGAICALASIIGDLLESLLKRVAGMKDAGASLPGLGGFLDFFDSSLIAFPAVYFMLIALQR
jgi:phosphatidate cytidylyltransferase